MLKKRKSTIIEAVLYARHCANFFKNENIIYFI